LIKLTWGKLLAVETRDLRRPRRRAGEKRDADATRRALLHAGAVLFPEKGFEGVSVEDLAERAGVNKALISYHFGGKRGLYVAVLESGFAAMAERLQEIEDAADARDGLHRLFNMFERTARERPDFPVLFLREAVSKGLEPAVLPHLIEILGITRRLAARGHREGLFRRVDPLLFHFNIIGALAFFLATEPARHRAAAHFPFQMPSPETFIRHLEEMTLRGLAPGPPPVTRGKSIKKKGARS
jgi:AcrR family transcriptional regulator